MKYEISELLDFIITDPDVSEWNTKDTLSFLIGFCSKDNSDLADLFSEIRSRGDK